MKKKIGIIVTESISLKLYPDFYPLLIERGYEIVGICAEGEFIKGIEKQGVKVKKVPFTREITPINDLMALIKLIIILKKEKCDVVIYSTPKASFLSAIATRLLGIPSIYIIRGEGYESYKGIKRIISMGAELITCRLSPNILAISNYLIKRFHENRLIGNSSKIDLIYKKGSSKGVNLTRFKLTDSLREKANSIRNWLNIPMDGIVIGFAGRINIEKGIIELIDSFLELSHKYKNIYLLLVGLWDKRYPIPSYLKNVVKLHPRIRYVKFVEDVENYIGAMDIVAIPSYREGFGSLSIEASALEKPVIVTEGTGAQDTIIEGVTGLLVKPKDKESLKQALIKLIESKELRERMGKAGRKWVEDNFDRTEIWNFLINKIESVLRERDTK